MEWILGHRFTAATCLLAVSILLFGSISHELKRTERCDTTYINPRYERVSEVTFGGGVPYSLIRYREAPSLWAPADVVQRSGQAAVLFVHGHLGSHEQMRSMASEMAKEISRRIKASIDVDTVDWYGADFSEEPSGLEPRLLERQAAFVTSCMDHLSSSYTKLVLIGYSMGGLVVDRVLKGQGTGDRFVDSLAMAITIGSPHFHLPTLVIPPKINRKYRTIESKVPTLHVFSGPGDVLVPSISAWSVHARDWADHPNLVEVDLENVPGVWGTASHKGLVSCNQLVRRVVPLILDGIRLVSPVEVQRLMVTRMTSDVQIDVMKLEDGFHTVSESMPRHEKCRAIQDAIHEVEMNAGQWMNPVVCFTKSLHNRTAKSTTGDDEMVQITLHGLKPKKHVWVIAMDGDRQVGDLSHMLSPLPAMSIDEPAKNKRHWQDVIEGIDWMQNSTWLVEFSSEAARRHGASSVMLLLSEVVQHDEAQESSLVKGRGLSVVSASRVDRLCSVPGCIISGTSVIGLNVPSMLTGPVRLLQRFVPVVAWKELTQIAPTKIVVKATSCDGKDISHSQRPVVISKKDPVGRHLDSDQIRTGQTSAFTVEAHHSTPKGFIDVPLWHPSLLSDTIFVAVDPTCQYSVALRPDILPAMTYAVRYHAYALPGLLLALTMLRVVPVNANSHGRWVVQYPPTRRYALLLALLSISASVLSRALTAWQAGSVPWLFLQTPLSIATISWIAICFEIVLKSLVCDCINITGSLSSLVPELLRTCKVPGRRWFFFAVLVCCVLHDFAPFFVAFLAICALALSGNETYIGKYSVVEWGFLLAAGVSPMVVAMSGGKLIPYPHRELYGLLSPERQLVAFVSMGSIGSLAKTSREGTCWRVATAALAALAALSSLFGYCFGGPLITLILVGMNQF